MFIAKKMNDDQMCHQKFKIKHWSGVITLCILVLSSHALKICARKYFEVLYVPIPWHIYQVYVPPLANHVGAYVLNLWHLLSKIDHFLFILIIVCQFMSNDSQHDQSFLNISLFNCSGSINLQILYSQSVFSISSSDFSLTQLLIYWADFTLYWYIYIIFRFFRVDPSKGLSMYFIVLDLQTLIRFRFISSRLV